MWAWGCCWICNKKSISIYVNSSFFVLVYPYSLKPSQTCSSRKTMIYMHPVKTMRGRCCYKTAWLHKLWYWIFKLSLAVAPDAVQPPRPVGCVVVLVWKGPKKGEELSERETRSSLWTAAPGRLEVLPDREEFLPERLGVLQVRAGENQSQPPLQLELLGDLQVRVVGSQRRHHPNCKQEKYIYVGRVLVDLTDLRLKFSNTYVPYYSVFWV